MNKRYIIVEEKEHGELPFFVVYKKVWLFKKYLNLFCTKEEAMSFVFSILRKDESYQRVVFDTKHDLKSEVMF